MKATVTLTRVLGKSREWPGHARRGDASWPSLWMGSVMAGRGCYPGFLNSVLPSLVSGRCFVSVLRC